MSAERSGTEPPEAPGGRSPTAAVAGFCGLIVLIVGLVLIGSWVTFAVALALMLLGVVGMARFLRVVTAPDSREAEDRSGVRGMHEDLSISEEVHDELSAHDVPLGNPARRELEEAREQPDRRGRG